MKKFAPALMASLVFSVAALAHPQSHPLQRNDSERELFELLNHERSLQGLPELRWDEGLFKAARQHALLMLNLNILEHQLPGEPSLEERITAAGAHFTFIAENIGLGKNPATIHSGWMLSSGHRRNILEPRANAVGIAVVHGTGGLFAVEDFSQSFTNMSLEQQEKQVASLLTAKGFHLSRTWEEGRRACNSDGGLPGVHEWAVVRFETGDLTALSPEVEKKIHEKSYHNVAVGACRTSEVAGFAHYRIALVFY